MTKSRAKTLDQKTLIEIMEQVYEKGQRMMTIEPKDIVQDLANRVRPYLEHLKHENEPNINHSHRGK